MKTAKKAAATKYTATDPLDTPALLFTSAQRRRISGHSDLGWSTILRGPLDVVELDGGHVDILLGARGEIIGTVLADRLRELGPGQR